MTMARDLQDIKETLGKLSGTVEAMFGRLDRSERDHREFVHETQESRRRLHEKVEEQREETAEAIKAQHATLLAVREAADATARNLAEITVIVKDDVKPQTDKIKKWELMGVGFLSMAALAGAGLATAVTTVVVNWGGAILDFFLKR